MPSDAHTPFGHARRYTSDCYVGMRDDQARTHAYAAAIQQAASGKVVLDIGTGALALLAIQAAKAGAAHVYALECNTNAASAARVTIAREGFSDKITVIEGFSTDAALSLPQKCSLLVHELIGEIAGEEGAVAAILDARRRFLDPHAGPPLSIPARSRTLLAPCAFPDAAYLASLRPGVLSMAPGQGQALRLPRLPGSCLLAPTQPFEILDFTQASPQFTQTAELHFTLEGAGLLRGLAAHVDLSMLADDEGLLHVDVSSAWEGSHWRNVLLLLSGGGVETQAGARVKVLARCELGGPLPRYTFETWLDASTSGAEEDWRSLGQPICLPDAMLNVNDAMDVAMCQQ